MRRENLLLEMVWEAAPDIQTRPSTCTVRRLRAKLGEAGDDRGPFVIRLPHSKRQRAIVKLAHRLLLQSLAIVMVMVIAVVVIIDNQIHSSITDQATNDLAGEARLLATQWKPGTVPDALADEAGVATGHRITLIDSTGRVVGDSEFDGPALDALENHAPERR